MLYGDFYYLCDIKKQLHFIYIMKTQSGIYLTALLLAGALTSSCSRQAPEPLPYPNDGVLAPHQQEAVGHMPRVVVMTDAEVDDRCSMVHFLLYSNDMEVAAIIQSNSCYQRHGWSSQPWLAKQLDAYEQVYPNLKVHDPNYPTPDYLRSVVFIGDENPDHVQLDGSTTRHLLPGTEPVIDPTDWPDTPGSDRIVELLTDDDPRPVYLQAWGGMNTAAKALQKIKAQYPEKYEAACRKAVLYCIWYQDAGGPYIERNHPGVTILLSHHFSGSWDYGTMTSSDNVVREYMHNGKNPLGACYVQPLISEGDSPSFLYSINNGLRSYEDPTYGGWGGRFYKVDGYENVYRDTGFGELREWLENCMHDFETRLSWCYTPRREDANHAPEVTVEGSLDFTVHSGDTIHLRAKVVDNDPINVDEMWKLYGDMWEQHGLKKADVKRLAAEDPATAAARFGGTTSNWYQYFGGTYPGKVDLLFQPDGSLKVVAPKVNRTETFHIVLEASDKAVPRLATYRRFIITVKP